MEKMRKKMEIKMQEMENENHLRREGDDIEKLMYQMLFSDDEYEEATE